MTTLPACLTRVASSLYSIGVSFTSTPRTMHVPAQQVDLHLADA